jgi:glycosyltransferase involved in cell wall biosynthesis
MNRTQTLAYWFILLLFCQLPLFALIEKRDTPLSLKVSLIIPCDAIRHSHHLPPLLDRYANQTVLPDEVVISIGPVSHVSKDIRNILNSNKWPFPVKVLYSQTRLNASANRNVATRAAIGDIFSYQDSDDIPHPQRIEILKYLFENYTIDHIMHDYVITVLKGDLPFQKWPAKHSNITVLVPITNYNELNWFVPEGHYPDLGANNSISITREVFDTIQWNEEKTWGEDCFFNASVYDVFENHIVLKNPLYEYLIRQ